MPTEIPKHILGNKRFQDMTPKEREDQQARIDKWLVEEAAKKAAKKFEEEGK